MKIITCEDAADMFVKPHDWHYLKWYNSSARKILRSMPWMVLECEKCDEYGEYSATFTMLPNNVRQKWWRDLPAEHKAVIKSFPGFTPEKFWRVFGIRTGENLKIKKKWRKEGEK